MSSFLVYAWSWPRMGPDQYDLHGPFVSLAYARDFVQNSLPPTGQWKIVEVHMIKVAAESRPLARG